MPDYSAPSRTLSVRATMTLLTGHIFSLTGDDILSYSLSEGATGGDMLLGSALSAHGTLTLLSPDGAWKKGGEKLGNRTLTGAEACIEIGFEENGAFTYTPAGSFIVSRIEAAEGEDTVTLSGYDRLLHLFSPVFTDSLTYPSPLQSILDAIAQQAGCTLVGTPLCNADTLITERPDWGDNCTLRQAIAWTAGAMGCFVRLTHEGSVQLVPLKRTSSAALSAQNALSLTLEDTLFTFNRLRVMPRKGKQYTEAALNESLPYSADNTLTIDDNPLFRAGSQELPLLTRNLANALSGLSFTPFSMTTPGDPALMAGDFLTITDLSGNPHPALLFSQQLTLSDGLTAHLGCDLETSGVSLPRIVTSSGKLSSAALTDGIIAARHIAAGAVDAEKISARSITADQIALGAITSDSGVIGQLSADSITAGKLSTDRLIVGGSEFSIVRALNQLKDSLSQNDSSIDGSVLSDKSIDTGKVTDDFGAGLELSSNAAVLVLAGKLDGTHSHMELTEDAINMVGGDINIATNDLEIRGMDDGGEIMSLDPEGLSAKRVTVTEAFSAPNVVFSHPFATAAWKGAIQPSIDALPKFLTQKTTLVIPAGVYEENVSIRGFVGEKLVITLSPGAKIHGTLSVYGCAAPVVIESATLGDSAIFPVSGGVYTVRAEFCQGVELKNLQISGYRGRTSASDGTSYAVYAHNSHLQVHTCCLEYSCSHAFLQQGGTFYAVNCSGGQESSSAATNANLGYGIVPANGAHGTLQGTGPVSVHGSAGGVTGTLILRNASVLAGGMEYTPPEYVTKSFPISKHCTYVYGDKRIRDDQSIFLSQGRYGAYETASHMTYWRTGAMWFAEATQVLQGKTIQSATLKLRRASGGWSGAVNVYLGSVALSESDFSSTTKPAFTPAANYPMGTLKRETEAIYDVTGLMSAVQSGHALGVFEPRDDYASGEGWSPAYTNFYGKGSEYEPVLTVTYK